jgi:RNA polymerase-binding transcription factor
MQNHEAVIDSLRHRLLARRASIIGRVARTEDLLGQLDETQPATEVEEEAQELNQARLTAQLEERGRAEIDAIDVAITRIERGEYGYCETCEEPIDVARLEVLPTARQCTTCAETNERRARLAAPVSTSDWDDDED